MPIGTHLLTNEQRGRERAIASAIAMDTVLVALLIAAGVAGGSLTMLAEGIRGGLGYLLECFTFVVLRRIHRGVLVDLDYGAGKLEQVANVVLAASMLLAAGWVAHGVMNLLAGQRSIGSPAGLAFGAVVGMLNLYVNVLAWDGVRRAMGDGSSVIMQAQLTLRRVKLVASLVVIVALTVAAISTDDDIVAVADGLGSLFVATYLVMNTIAVLRAALPDLLDRSAGDDVRRIVERTAGDGAALRSYRSRKSGHTVFIELRLAFDRALTIAEVQRDSMQLKTQIETMIAGAEVSIIPEVRE
jgi:divalent metal cation (Fe/Co/Zn/Cd) transporter